MAGGAYDRLDELGRNVSGKRSVLCELQSLYSKISK